MQKQIYPSDLTDNQWEHIKDLFPVHVGRRGRPRLLNLRSVVTLRVLLVPIYETEIIHKSGQHFGKELEPLFLVVLRDKLIEEFIQIFRLVDRKSVSIGISRPDCILFTLLIGDGFF